MPFRINHIHLKSPDPKKTADWYVHAFKFTIIMGIVVAAVNRDPIPARA